MKVAIACETSSFQLKEQVKKYIMNLGYEVEDVGQLSEDENVLYFEAAANLARKIQSGACERGLIANKFRGVYCVACESIFTAEKISLINNANVLAMGARVVSFDMGCEMAERFLAGQWCEGFAEQRRKNNERGFEVLKQIEEEQRYD